MSLAQLIRPLATKRGPLVSILDLISTTFVHELGLVRSLTTMREALN